VAAVATGPRLRVEPRSHCPFLPDRLEAGPAHRPQTGPGSHIHARRTRSVLPGAAAEVPTSARAEAAVSLSARGLPQHSPSAYPVGHSLQCAYVAVAAGSADEIAAGFPEELCHRKRPFLRGSVGELDGTAASAPTHAKVAPDLTVVCGVTAAIGVHGDPGVVAEVPALPLGQQGPGPGAQTPLRVDETGMAKCRCADPEAVDLLLLAKVAWRSSCTRTSSKAPHTGSRTGGRTCANLTEIEFASVTLMIVLYPITY
jgi:hypothetical protein